MNHIVHMTRPVMDRANVEAVLARIAIATFTYYPGKAAIEPGYLVEEDVEWALDPLRALDDARMSTWRERVTAVIVDPPADRRAFIDELMELAEP